MKLSHENGGLLKIIILLAHIDLSVQKYATNMDHVKGEDPPESIGASFLKIVAYDLFITLLSIL